MMTRDLGDIFLLFTQILRVCLLYVTVCDAMYCSPPGSSVHADSPGKNTEVCYMPSTRESAQPRDRTLVSRIAGAFFTI